MDRPTPGIPRDAYCNWIQFNCTDVGFAERMLFWYPDRFQYGVQSRRWIMLGPDGPKLGSDSHLEMLRLIYPVVKAMDEERAHPDFPFDAKEFDRFRQRCGMSYGQRAMLRCLARELGVPIPNCHRTPREVSPAKRHLCCCVVTSTCRTCERFGKKEGR